MFTINSRKSIIFVALLVLLSAGSAGVVMAAAPTVDPAGGTQSSDITDGGTQTYNQTTNSNISWSADSNNTKIVVEQGNDTLFTATPEPYAHNSSGNEDSFYNVSLADDGSDYDGLDADAGEDVTLNVTLINNTEVDNPNETNISYTFANGNEVAFEDVEDGDVQEPEDGYFSSDDSSDKAKTDSTVGIAGNETDTVIVSVAGTPMADALDASAEDTESGDIIWGSATGLEDGYVLISNSEAPDTEWFDDDSAYATYDSDAQTLTYHNVNERVDEDAKDVELSATGNDGLGLFNMASMLQSYDASTTTAWSTAAWNADWSEPEWEDADE